jgi:anti-sigma factor RsiW
VVEEAEEVEVHLEEDPEAAHHLTQSLLMEEQEVVTEKAVC